MVVKNVTGDRPSARGDIENPSPCGDRAPLPGSRRRGFGYPTAAYIHIPFCRRRCFYCDFPISVTGDRRHGGNFSPIEPYVASVCTEMAIARASVASLDLGPAVPLETVFFGGGTPSLLTPEQLERLLEALSETFGLAAGAEISMEMDPGTFDLEKLQRFRDLGINRVSLGVQAFDDRALAACGRSHRVADIERAIGWLKDAAIDNWSLDLISGLPYQSRDTWLATLERAIAAGPAHLSVYDLIVEPKTAFDRYYQAGQFPLPAEELTADFYRLARDVLTAGGYDRYEISNYARPGYRCRHNYVYWQNESYWGFGMGATSYVGGRRYSRPRTLEKYERWLAEYDAKQGEMDCPVVSEGDRWLETIMLGLRLRDGLNCDRLVAEFGRDAVEKAIAVLSPYIENNYVEFNGQSRRLALSDPEGFLLSNTIIATVFEAFDTAD